MNIDDLNIIVLMKFGSHLYGTDTPESDTDIKGIFLPSEDEVLLGRIPKSYTITTKKTREEGIKNSSEDIDTEIFSLHQFIKLASEGQTVALDMLHAPENMIIKNSDIWEMIVNQRKRFYTKNLKAFIGYARRQAAKYGIKGSRLNTAKEFIDLLQVQSPTIKLNEIWDDILKIKEHVHGIESTPQGIKQISICGKTFQGTQTVKYAFDIIENFYVNYGFRAQRAAENKGIDWKALSHALRAAYEIRELLQYQTITFPLAEAKFLKGVKQGKHDYTTVVAPLLEDLMEVVEKLSEKSKLPEKVDKKYWDSFIKIVVKDNVIKGG